MTFRSYLESAGITFQDWSLLETALVHRSYVHEKWELVLESNERLEFLGDSVLNFVTARFLYGTFPGKGEGELTALRAALVRTSTLARFSRGMELGAALKLGKGEEQSGGRERDPLLADAFEAVVAAIYLHNGLDDVDRLLRPLLEVEVATITEHGLVLDDKSQLQERVQAERNQTPRYKTVRSEGPDHDRRFTIEVWAGSDLLGVGEGASKQAAAQAAARAALDVLDNPSPQPAV